jgi:hypothetical protein
VSVLLNERSFTKSFIHYWLQHYLDTVMLSRSYSMKDKYMFDAQGLSRKTALCYAIEDSRFDVVKFGVTLVLK